MKNNLFDRKEIAKFILVGILNTAVGAGTMFFLYNVAHRSYWFSSVCNYVAGGIVSFFLNKYFTFKNQEKSIMQILLFVLNTLACYLVAYIGAKKFVGFLLRDSEIFFVENFAMLCGMCIFTALNFIGQKCVVFAGRKRYEN